MKTKINQVALWGMSALLAGSLLSPLSALGDNSRQKKKNNWRNGTIAAGALGAYGLLKGNKTATVLGVAGAAYSANRYEQERKSQDKRKRAHARYHRSDGSYVRDGKKYYKYHGDMYYMDLKTGERHRVG